MKDKVKIHFLMDKEYGLVLILFIKDNFIKERNKEKELLKLKEMMQDMKEISKMIKFMVKDSTGLNLEKNTQVHLRKGK